MESPSLDEFLVAAREDNPDVPERALKQYWNQKYGHINPATLPSWETFKPAATTDNPGIPETQLRHYWEENYGVFGAPEKEDRSSDIVRGAKHAFQQIPQTLYGVEAGLGAAAEKVVGEGGIATGIKEHGVKKYEEQSAKIAATSKPTDSIQTAYEMASEGDIGALADWLQYALGYTGGQVLQMLGTAGVGYVAGKVALQPVASTVAQKLVAKEAARLGATEAGAKLAASELTKQSTKNVAAKIGQTAALGATATGMEGGEIFGEMVSQAEREQRSLTGDELAKAFGASLTAGALEFVGDKIGLDIILGRSPVSRAGSRLGRAAAGGLADLATESATEFAQTILEEYGKGNDPFADQSIREALDAAALGAVGGTVVGGAGGALTTPLPPVTGVTEPFKEIVTNETVGIDEAIQRAFDLAQTPTPGQKAATQRLLDRVRAEDEARAAAKPYHDLEAEAEEAQRRAEEQAALQAAKPAIREELSQIPDQAPRTGVPTPDVAGPDQTPTYLDFTVTKATKKKPSQILPEGAPVPTARGMIEAVQRTKGAAPQEPTIVPGTAYTPRPVEPPLPTAAETSGVRTRRSAPAPLKPVVPWEGTQPAGVPVPSEAAKARAEEMIRDVVKSQRALEEPPVRTRRPEDTPIIGAERASLDALRYPKPTTAATEATQARLAQIAKERESLLTRQPAKRSDRTEPPDEGPAPTTPSEPPDTGPSLTDLEQLADRKGISQPVFDALVKMASGKTTAELTPQDRQKVAAALAKVGAKTPEPTTPKKETPVQPVGPAATEDLPRSEVITRPRSELSPEQNQEMLLRAEKAQADLEIAGTSKAPPKGKILDQGQGGTPTERYVGTANASWYKELTSGKNPPIKGDKNKSARQKIEEAIQKIIADQGLDRGTAVERVKAALLDDHEFMRTEWGREYQRILDEGAPATINGFTEQEARETIDRLTTAAEARRAQAKDESIRALRPTASDWMIEDELDELTKAQAAIGAFEKAGAQARVEDKRRQRLAERENLGLVDDKAHEAATSPENDLPEPSQAEKESGVYKKGHLRISGLDISIENPEGSERSGTDKGGKPWRQTMTAHYGYIRSIDKDGRYFAPKDRTKEHIDIFVKPGTPDDYSGPVFVVDQNDPSTGRFDEFKVMLGFATEAEAKAAYLANYASDWQGFRSIKQFTLPEFKVWLKAGNKQKPVGVKKPEKKSATMPPMAPDRGPGSSENAQSPPEPGRKKKYEPLTYRSVNSKQSDRGKTFYRGATDPTATKWVTDNRDAAQEYADEVDGQVYSIRLIGPIASPKQYPVLEGYDPKSDLPELNFDAIADAYDDGYVAIGPIEDMSGSDRPHRSWVVVGDLVPQDQKTGDISPNPSSPQAGGPTVSSPVKEGQQEISVPPPTIGERPIIGREAQPEEAPLFSKLAQETDAEQTEIPTEETPASPTEILAKALRTAADQIEGKPAKPKETKPRESSLTDVGEELWYNKRNRLSALKWDDVKDLNPTLKVKEVTKAKVWPRPDYEQLITDGLHPLVAHLVKQMYDGIAAAPPRTADEDLRQYIETINKAREVIFDWAKSLNANTAMIETLMGDDRGDRFKATTALTRDAQVGVLDKLIKREGGTWTDHEGRPYRSILGDRFANAIQPGFNEVIRAKDAIKEGWPAPQESWQKQFEIKLSPAGETVYTKNGKKTLERDEYYIVKRKKSGWGRQIVASGFATREDAIAKARELAERKGTGPDEEDLPLNLQGLQRTGRAYRQKGENITPQQLKDTFGFRGVNFGNWTNQSERQAHVNLAYDAFMDLAELLNVPPKALSLNGLLGVAFGAQGSGKYAAHFVPGVNEINLTKTKGAGSLAHEWAHALDHYFAIQAGEPFARGTDPFMTSQYRRVRTEQMKAKTQAVREEVQRAFQGIVEAMTMRPETEAEVAARIEANQANARTMIGRWIASITQKVPEAKRGEIERIGEKLKLGDVGEGYVVLGKSSAVRPRVQELREAYKAATGHLLGKEDTEGVSAWVDTLMFTKSAKAAEQTHAAQTPTAYAKAARSLDKEKSGKAYWTQPTELFARAFQSYVIDTLASKAARNDYLSRPQQKDSTRYPQGEERTRINAAFDTLVAELKTRETDQGMALYQLDSTMDPPSHEALSVQAEIEGRTAVEAARFLATAAPSEAHRLIAGKVAEQLANLEAAGMAFDLKIAHLNDRVPAMLIGTRGLTWLPEGSSTTQIWLQGADVEGYVGTSYETVLHELIHGATQAALHIGNLPSQKGTPLWHATQDLYAVGNAIMDHVNREIAAARKEGRPLTPLQARLTQRTNAFHHVGEIVAWALSSRDMQEYLESIPYQHKSLWTRFVEAIRTFLGLAPASHTALSEVLRISEELLQADTSRLMSTFRDVWMPTQINQYDGLLNEQNQPGLLNEQVALPRQTAVALRGVTDLTPAQTTALERVHGKPLTWHEKLNSFKTDWKTRLTQGLFDQYAPIFNYDKKAYMLARLSKGGDGTLEALLLYGKPYVDQDGAYQVDTNGGFAKVLAGLKGEHDRFLEWVAALRADRLKKVGLENLYSDHDIQTLKTLNQGTMKDGSSRPITYEKALLQLNEWNAAMTKLAVDSGLIDKETADTFKDVPYVPFYRLQEEGIVTGFAAKPGLVNQYAWKRLKGGTQHLNDDLLANVLQNWSHLITAAARNRAAKETLTAAEKAGVASPVPSGAPGKGLVQYMDGGKAKTFAVSDPALLDAITALHYAGMGTLGKPFAAMKRALTFGVTVSPSFKIRNLIRDTIQAIGTADLSYNPFENLKTGFKALEDPKTRGSLMAGGGMIRFGTMLDGNNADRARILIERGVHPQHILDSPNKIERFWKQWMLPVFEAYQELGDKGEQVNRAALYQQMRAKGLSHLEASYMARDLMDFSLMGKWEAVRILAQVVPFANARLQGLYKLGRARIEDYRRLGTVLGAVSLASLALLLAYQDDPDWERREEWDRNNFWWFKIGDVAFRIPKPFEIGAIGTLAERGAELIISDEMTGARFAQQLGALVSDQLSMNPTPQLLKPLLDLYANKDSFTDKPIETMGMERLRKEDRYSDRTSELARLLGQLGLPDPTQLAMGRWEALSPVQLDHLVHAYFGWLGTSITTALDFGIRPLVTDGEKPAMKLKDVFLVGSFVESLPASGSRYVTQLYEQAKEVEQAYGSFREALKRGDYDRAREIQEDEGDKLRQYTRIERVKRTESEIATRIKQIERSPTLSGDEKRVLIDRLKERKHLLARSVAVTP